MSQKKVDFGQWLGKLAQTAEGATADTVAKLQEKMQAEHQARVEQKLRNVYNSMERQVDLLRAVRRQEKTILKTMDELQEKANKIVAGTDED